MTALWMLIGLFAGAAVVAAALRPRLRALSVEAARTHELEHELLRATTELQHERERAEERLQTVQDAQERLSDSFKALSAATMFQRSSGRNSTPGTANLPLRRSLSCLRPSAVSATPRNARNQMMRRSCSGECSM